jgi:6-phosphogluconolactonase
MSDAAPRIRWAERADASAIADFIARKLAGGGLRYVAVPGGSTPGPIFAELAKREMDWENLQFILTDDRQVPDDHPASNLRLLREHLGDTGAQIVPLFPALVPPHFDLCWLGMGTDGHIASLFPHMRVSSLDAPGVVETLPDPLPPEAPYARLSFNMPALLASNAIMLVINGDEKKTVIEAAIAGENDLPIARLLAGAHCEVTIFWSAE